MNPTRTPTMDPRRMLLGIARLVLVASTALFFFDGGPSSEPTAQALQGNAGPVVVDVVFTPDRGGVLATAVAPDGVLIYEIAAHLCRHDSGVRTIFDFNFQGTKCTNQSVGGSDVDQRVEYSKGTQVAELPFFRIGQGSANWVNSRGSIQEITCGPGAPCDVVIQLQITNGTVHFPAPICFDPFSCTPDAAGGEPPPEPPPAPALAPPTEAAPATAERDGDVATGAATTTTTTPRKAGAESTSQQSDSGGGSSTSSNRDPTEAPRASGISVATSQAANGMSQATRVRTAALAGVAGGALIAGLIAHGRRRLGA